MATPKDNQKIRVLRNLIETHKIVFRGVEPKSAWPQVHAPLFQKVFDADRRWYGQTLQSEGLNVVEKELLKQQVGQVVRAVKRCRQDLDVESTWRIQIEKYITGRFERETNCQKCSRTTPGHRTRYLSRNAFESRELESRPRIRRACDCATSENYEDRYETGEVNIFNIKGDSQIMYFDHEVLHGEGVPETKPDCIVGLATTESMKKCIALRNDLRHHPFKNQNHRQLVYPFLLIEAKSEKGSPGFESIEAQSAFPIMTMLKIQAQLGTDPDCSTSSLVWFIAYAGGDVRLYGCVNASTGFDVFELWHGSLSYHDKVFRLFYIIDLICDWAREYRRTVQSRLVPNQEQLREWTPASTVLSSQGAMYNVPALAEGSLNRIDADQQLLGLRITDNGDHPADTSMNMNESYDEDDSEEAAQENFVDHDELFHDPSGQPHSVVIRHVDTVKYHFRHVIVPDRAISRFSVDEFNRIQQMVRYAYTERSFLPISNDSVKALEAYWLGIAPHKLSSHLESEHLCLVKLSTSFDPENLLPVRSLFCVTLSTELLEAIMEDQPIQILVPKVSSTSSLQAESLIKDFATMGRSFSRRDSIYSSLLGLEYHLVPGRPPLLGEQRRYRNLFGDPSGMKNALFEFVAAIPTMDSHQRSAIRTLFPGQHSTPITVPETFGSRENFVVGGKTWADGMHPDLVVLVASDVVYDRFNMRRKLPRLLRSILSLKDTYQAKHSAEMAADLQLAADIVLETCPKTFEMTTTFHEYVKQSTSTITSNNQLDFCRGWKSAPIIIDD